MAYDITALGEILIDFVPDGTDEDGDARFVRKAGGAPLNLLAAAAKAGMTTSFIGCVGDDINGAFLTETVRRVGVDCGALFVDSLHNTTLAFVELDADGDRRFSFYRTFGADRFLDKSRVDVERIRQSKVFHFGSLSLTDEPSLSATEYALEVAREAGCTVTYDPNYRPLLWQSAEQAAQRMGRFIGSVDILKASEEEVQMIAGKTDVDEAVAAVTEQGVKVALVTLGANGSVVYFGGEKRFIPPFDVDTIDTTGAGDIYFGTFLSEWLKSGRTLDELTLSEISEFAKTATVVAAKSTCFHGAIASLEKI
ncbi:MAG TPA: carbohydrate kinase [Ruminococcaceae bacterium]|nr:carbohydrate kinase [Oscillospiraceae bacterium]